MSNVLKKVFVDNLNFIFNINFSTITINEFNFLTITIESIFTLNIFRKFSDLFIFDQFNINNQFVFDQFAFSNRLSIVRQFTFRIKRKMNVVREFCT